MSRALRLFLTTPPYAKKPKWVRPSPSKCRGARTVQHTHARADGIDSYWEGDRLTETKMKRERDKDRETETEREKQ